MFVDFFGVPGCGKTFQANLFKKELEQKGEKYIDLSRWKGMPFWLKVFYKIADKTYVYIPNYSALRNKLKRISKNADDKLPCYLPFSVDYCIDRIVSSIFVQDVFGNSTKTVINDEGLMQWVVFLNVQYGVAIDSIMDALQPLNKNCHTRFVEVDIETAFFNIKNRNRHVCPMDEMDDEQLMQYLSDFHKGCMELKKYINT